MKRDSSIFYRSFYEAINDLPDENQLEVYKSIFEYTLNFNEIELNGLSKTIFTLIKPQLDANNKRYENGSKGGRKKQDETKTEANKNDNNNDNNNENENDNEKDLPPTAKEKSFKQFSKEDFYESIKPFVEKYSNKTCKAFFKYWNEPDPKGKMRFQLEKTWSISHRLSTWKERESKFGTEPVKPINNNVPLGPWNV